MDLVSRKSLEEKMIPLIAELFKEDTTVEIAKGLLRALADEPAVRSAGSDAEDGKSEEGEQT